MYTVTEIYNISGMNKNHYVNSRNKTTVDPFSFSETRNCVITCAAFEKFRVHLLLLLFDYALAGNESFKLTNTQYNVSF